MNQWEQLEAFVEMRIIERRATRGEVYALRAYRRDPNTTAKRRLVVAVMNVFCAPLIALMRRIGEACVDLSRKLNAWVLEHDVGRMEQADMGEFDNRAHDWIREGDEQTR